MEVWTEISPRDDSLGGGWNLKVYQDGKEIAGGVFPLTEEELDFIGDERERALDRAYSEAMESAETW